MVDFKVFPKAKIFAAHGVDFTSQRGDELIGVCPLTGKADKFFVNSKTWLWDSKTASMSGNIPQFLKAMHEEEYQQELTEDLLKKLAAHRRLARAALRPWNLGWNGRAFMLPVRDGNGTYVDIRTYSPVKKMMRSTPGCHTGLFGAERLAEDPAAPVYVCEGEWDAMAMAYLLALNSAPGFCVAVPGAGVFKQEWVPLFTGRKVYAIYDHDDAGMRGEVTLQKRLTGVAKSITYTHWPNELPDGFDLRDWVVYGVTEKKTPDKCFQRLQFLFKKEPREDRRAGNQVGRESGKVLRIMLPRQKTNRPTLDDVHAVFNKWLHLTNTDAVDVMLASVLSQRIDGPPVWMFLVSPPGGAKTVTLSGLTEYDKVYSTSSLTAHALISGANWQGQTDPSLIPRLDGKVLVIKDFTSILGLRDVDKEEIFSILRDAYDGKCGKVFGNGVERSYVSRFTIVAAVTPRIYDMGEQHASLGERFLKYSMGDNLHHEAEDDIISKAINNVDQDSLIRDELSRVTADFLQHSREEAEIPVLDNAMHRRIVALAKFGARIRGTVSRNTFQSEMMTGRPFAEVGSRLGIQLAKLARSIALVRGRPEATEDEYRIVKKIMLDTVSQRNEDIVRAIYKATPRADDRIATNDIATATRYPMSTVRRVLDDMHMLQVVMKRGVGYRHTWALTDYIRRQIAASGLYATADERERPRRLVIRVPRKQPRA